MCRLNSGNLNGSVCRTFKIIKNDTKIATISWGTKVEIPFLNFCLGGTVGVQYSIKFIRV